MSNTDKKVGLIVRVENLVSGLQALAASTLGSLRVGGVAYSKAQIVTKLQGIATLFSTVSSAKAAYQAAMSARVAQGAANSAFVVNLRSALVQALGNDPATLQSLGISVKSSGRRTPKKKSVVSTTAPAEGSSSAVVTASSPAIAAGTAAK